jgi:hypothetical protein
MHKLSSNYWRTKIRKYIEGNNSFDFLCPILIIYKMDITVTDKHKKTENTTIMFSVSL